uniref:Gem-associated protein 8 n=1 Tax=Anopheles minimus TaxID=112268 RepID=A0A182W9R2_9DIPT
MSEKLVVDQQSLLSNPSWKTVRKTQLNNSMKRVAELECKNVAVGKSREKLLRSRNKRKCKRKKNSRTIKRLCPMKEPTANQCSSEQYQRDNIRRLQPHRGIRAAAGAVPCGELRLKHAQNVWIRTYQRIVKWHGKHQTNYWKHCAQQLKAENDRLKRAMCATRPLTNGNHAVESDSEEELQHSDDPFGDTEDESAEELEAIKGSRERPERRHKRRTSLEEQQREERNELDEEFLAFMEISARHRLEHQRLKNESVHYLDL